MSKFKIVFLDGKEIKVKALNFSEACTSAKHSRLQAGEAQVNQLFIDEKACSIIDSKRKKMIQE